MFPVLPISDRSTPNHTPVRASRRISAGQTILSAAKAEAIEELSKSPYANGNAIPSYQARLEYGIPGAAGYGVKPKYMGTTGRALAHDSSKSSLGLASPSAKQQSGKSPSTVAVYEYDALRRQVRFKQSKIDDLQNEVEAHKAANVSLKAQLRALSESNKRLRAGLQDDTPEAVIPTTPTATGSNRTKRSSQEETSPSKEILRRSFSERIDELQAQLDAERRARTADTEKHSREVARLRAQLASTSKAPPSSSSSSAAADLVDAPVNPENDLALLDVDDLKDENQDQDQNEDKNQEQNQSQEQGRDHEAADKETDTTSPASSAVRDVHDNAQDKGTVTELRAENERLREELSAAQSKEPETNKRLAQLTEQLATVIAQLDKVSAVKIQAVYRGHASRKLSKSPKPRGAEPSTEPPPLQIAGQDEAAAVKIQAAFRGHAVRKKVKTQRQSGAPGAAEAVAPVASANDWGDDEDEPFLTAEQVNEPESPYDSKHSEAAVRIQSRFRGHAVRRQAKLTAAAKARRKQEEELAAQRRADEILKANLAATKLQAQFRGYETRKQLQREGRVAPHKVAIKVQVYKRLYKWVDGSNGDAEYTPSEEQKNNVHALPAAVRVVCVDTGERLGVISVLLSASLSHLVRVIKHTLSSRLPPKTTPSVVFKGTTLRAEQQRTVKDYGLENDSIVHINVEEGQLKVQCSHHLNRLLGHVENDPRIDDLVVACRGVPFVVQHLVEFGSWLRHFDTMTALMEGISMSLRPYNPVAAAASVREALKTDRDAAAAAPGAAGLGCGLHLAPSDHFTLLRLLAILLKPIPEGSPDPLSDLSQLHLMKLMHDGGGVRTLLQHLETLAGAMWDVHPTDTSSQPRPKAGSFESIDSIAATLSSQAWTFC